MHRALTAPDMPGSSRCLADTRVLGLDAGACEHKQLASGLGARFTDHFKQYDPPDVCVGTTVCSQDYRVSLPSAHTSVWGFVPMRLRQCISDVWQVVAGQLASGHIPRVPIVRPSWLTACQKSKAKVGLHLVL